jgi:hypothetical protein
MEQQQTRTGAGQAAIPKTVLLRHKSRQGDRLVYRPQPGGLPDVLAGRSPKRVPPT